VHLSFSCLSQLDFPILNSVVFSNIELIAPPQPHIPMCDDGVQGPIMLAVEAGNSPAVFSFQASYRKVSASSRPIFQPTS
jgi:hypothetical protein